MSSRHDSGFSKSRSSKSKAEAKVSYDFSQNLYTNFFTDQSCPVWEGTTEKWEYQETGQCGPSRRLTTTAQNPDFLKKMT